MDLAIFFSGLSIAIGLAAYWPYFRGIFSGQVVPHAFTWLIWGITQGVATAGMWVGGAGLGTLPFAVNLVFIFLIFFLALKDGNRHITNSDVLVLIAALSATGVWWLLENPLLAVLLVAAIDVIGYAPSFRKSYHEPWSENVISWIAFATANIFAMLAVERYTLLTMSYLVAIFVANVSFALFLMVRRKMVLASDKGVPSSPRTTRRDISF